MPIKPKIQTILFATDLSENARHAFAYAAGMADAYNADITVLHVIEKLPPKAELFLVAILGMNDTDELREKSQSDLILKIKEHIGHFCAEMAERMPECRFSPNAVLVEPGNAADRILHHAGTGSYDALVIGTHGHGIIHETMMGGTSRKVVLESPIPVFVIPMRKTDKD